MKIKNHNDVGGGDRGFCKGIREGANVILVIMALALSPLAYGMPSEQKLKEVKPLVDSLIADDMQAMKAKKKSPKDVAVALVAFADKAESEAGKFLLLHKAFYVSARGNIDDYAAYVLNRIRNEIADVSAEYIVDLVSKEIRNISAVKSPKVFAIYSEAKRTVDLRRRLATIVSRLRKEPDDKALLRQQAEILAALGNWTRALEIYVVVAEKPKGVCKTGDTKTITLPGGAKMELIYCAPGLFLMGNPRKGGQQVTISKGFWLGKYEVSQAQWKSVMGDNPSHFKGNDKPVDSVTWDDCQSFIKKVNNSLKCESRLPTEAEWEYACRAGTTWDYGGTGQLDGMGWYDGNSGQTTHSIGKKSANSWGFYDMHGNVWEWCFDWEGPLMYGTDPNGPPSGSRRVLRGGSWSYNADCSKSFNRGRNFPNAVCEDFGFRLCMSAE